MTSQHTSAPPSTNDKAPSYTAAGWHHWPDDPWMSYQFRRGLGETQEGAGMIGEVFQAASRMVANDLESWHREWMRIAERSDLRGDQEMARKHVRSAMNCWLRAANYFREAEFWLKAQDPRRMTAFERCEAASKKYLAQLTPKAEVVDIPYEPSKPMPAYFVRSVNGGQRQPVLISIGGLDSFKDELWFMTGRGALQRGMSVLLVDGPGQGGALRRYGLIARHDYEIPIGKCIDWLEQRDDVDTTRIALSGSSLGGHYAARAGSMESRLAACISHGAVWDVGERWKSRDDSHALAAHICWVFGARNMAEAAEKAKPFKLDGVLEKMKCPYLIINGGADVLGVEGVKMMHEYAVKHGVNVTLRVTTPDETGADHCQHDNPTLGQELMLDWLCDVFRIDQSTLAFYPG
jgi:dienelactone hydrolase